MPVEKLLQGRPNDTQSPTALFLEMRDCGKCEFTRVSCRRVSSRDSQYSSFEINVCSLRRKLCVDVRRVLAPGKQGGAWTPTARKGRGIS